MTTATANERTIRFLGNNDMTVLVSDDAPSRLLAIGPADFERFFRALAAAWTGPYDRERTPAAVGPVFERFGMRFCQA